MWEDGVERDSSRQYHPPFGQEWGYRFTLPPYDIWCRHLFHNKMDGWCYWSNKKTKSRGTETGKPYTCSLKRRLGLNVYKTWHQIKLELCCTFTGRETHATDRSAERQAFWIWDEHCSSSCGSLDYACKSFCLMSCTKCAKMCQNKSFTSTYRFHGVISLAWMKS